jgi:hypothetical protein
MKTILFCVAAVLLLAACSTTGVPSKLDGTWKVADPVAYATDEIGIVGNLAKDLADFTTFSFDGDTAVFVLDEMSFTYHLAVSGDVLQLKTLSTTLANGMEVPAEKMDLKDRKTEEYAFRFKADTLFLTPKERGIFGDKNQEFALIRATPGESRATDTDAQPETETNADTDAPEDGLETPDEDGGLE